MNNVWITSDGVIVEEYTEAEVKEAEAIVSMLNTVMQNVPERLGKLILAANEDDNNSTYQLRTVWDNNDELGKWQDVYEKLCIELYMLGE